MVGENDVFGEVGESETKSLQDEERLHLQCVEMVKEIDTEEALTDISKVSTILFIASGIRLLPNTICLNCPHSTRMGWGSTGGEEASVQMVRIASMQSCSPLKNARLESWRRRLRT